MKTKIWIPTKMNSTTWLTDEKKPESQGGIIFWKGIDNAKVPIESNHQNDSYFIISIPEEEQQASLILYGMPQWLSRTISKMTGTQFQIPTRNQGIRQMKINKQKQHEISLSWLTIFSDSGTSIWIFFVCPWSFQLASFIYIIFSSDEICNKIVHHQHNHHHFPVN